MNKFTETVAHLTESAEGAVKLDSTHRNKWFYALVCENRSIFNLIIQKK